MYREVISLGWFCGTASSMSRYGYRSSSTPFDWVYSELKGILKLIDEDFEGFMSKDNIKFVDGKPKEFIDTKYGMHFIHEIKNNFENEYEIILNRYKKRIQNFRAISTKGVVYLRAVRNQDELNYLTQHQQYIRQVVTKYNSNNQIIYLLPEYLVLEPNIELNYFNLKSSYDGSSIEALRGMFNKNQEIIEYLDNIINPIARNENLLFDVKKENKRLQTRADKFLLLEKLINADISSERLPSRIAIYGLGVIGRYFYHVIKDLVEVVCFIDSNTETRVYDNIKVCSRNELIDPDVVIVVTPTQYYNEISSYYLNEMKLEPSNIISIENLI